MALNRNIFVKKSSQLNNLALFQNLVYRDRKEVSAMDSTPVIIIYIMFCNIVPDKS